MPSNKIMPNSNYLLVARARKSKQLNGKQFEEFTFTFENFRRPCAQQPNDYRFDGRNTYSCGPCENNRATKMQNELQKGDH